MFSVKSSLAEAEFHKVLCTIKPICPVMSF